MDDLQLIIENLKAARRAAASATGSKLIDLKAASKVSGLSYDQLWDAIQCKRLTAFPSVGLMGELTGKYLVRLSDVKKLTALPRGRPRNQPIGV